MIIIWKMKRCKRSKDNRSWGASESIIEMTSQDLFTKVQLDKNDWLGGFFGILEFLCHKLKLNRFSRSEEWICGN